MFSILSLVAGTVARSFSRDPSEWLRVTRPPLRRAAIQGALFSTSSGAAPFDASFRALERLELGAGAWVDVVQGWLTDHEPLFLELRDTTDWHAHTRVMYERRVAVPRLTGTPQQAGKASALLSSLAHALSVRYGRPLVEVSLAFYRDGTDSVAMHGDHLEGDQDDALVAILTLGASRRFVMKRVKSHGLGGLPLGGEPAQGSRFWRGSDRLMFSPGAGDLLVMGGTCQRSWLHGVPKAASVGERIAVMFR